MPQRGASPGLLRHNNQPKMGSDINYADCNNSSTESDFLFSSGQSVSIENIMAASQVDVINYKGLVSETN